MRRALGKARFGFIESRKYAGEIILGEDCFGSRGEVYFWPKEYSSAKMAQKRIDKLIAALVRIIAGVAAAAFLLALYRGMDIGEAIRYVLALSVSAVPESLPIAITVVLVPFPPPVQST